MAENMGTRMKYRRRARFSSSLNSKMEYEGKEEKENGDVK
jgi:hypothetical protein